MQFKALPDPELTARLASITTSIPVTTKLVVKRECVLWRMAKRQRAEETESLKKKRRFYQDSFLMYGFIDAMDKIKIECIFCGEKLANESMKTSKLKRHQVTKHPETTDKSIEYFVRKKEMVFSNRPQNIRESSAKVGSH